MLQRARNRGHEPRQRLDWPAIEPAPQEADCRRETSSRRKDRMIGQTGGVEQPSLDIFGFQKWIVSQNLFARCTGSEQLQQVDNPKSRVAYARPSAALFRVDGDAFK